MKKVFFYVAAAMTMLAGCQKAELNQTQTPVDDTTPVAMQLGAASPSFTLTKAAVNEWASTPVFVYGLLNGENGYEAIIDNYETVVVDATTPLEIYDVKDLKMPYFYKEGKTYDFFGYHLGGAEKVTEPALAADVVAFEVKYDGNDDVMYAYADKAIDVMKDPTAQVREADAYSAWAARRNVQPNLVFKHALTKFNFIVKGMNAKSENVTVTGITVESVDNGTLTVVNKDASKLAFVPADVEAVEFALTNWDDTEFTPVEVLNGVEIIAGSHDPLVPENSASIMVAPGMTELPVVVTMLNNKFNKELDPYTFTAKASDVRKVGLAENAGLVEFAAGTAYNIYINVYGPEEIVVTAELTDWEEAGDYTYDPDAFRPDGTPSTFVAAALESVAAGQMTATFTTSDDIAALQAALKEKDSATEPADADYKDVVLTKAMNGTVEFTGLDDAKVYELVVRYKTDLAKDYTPVKNVEVVAPAAATTIAATSFITDKASFDAFCAGQLTWYDDSTPQTLPWLAAKLGAGVKHANVVVTNEKGFKKTFNWAKADGTEIALVTVSEEELGGTKLVPGKWTLTVNGASAVIEIPEPYKFEVLATSVITDKASFDAFCADKLTWYDDSTPASLPWLAVKFTPTKNVKVTAACGDVRKTIEFTKENEVSLLTLNAEELGAEIVPGQTWYLNVNGVNVTINVPNIAEAWLVKDVTSFKKLPTSYRANYGEWGTPGLNESLPWLAVTFVNPVESVKWSVAHNGKKVASDVWTKNEGTISLVTFNKEELGTEIVAGTWTVTVNGDSADIVVE